MNGDGICGRHDAVVRQLVVKVLHLLREEGKEVGLEDLGKGPLSGLQASLCERDTLYVGKSPPEMTLRGERPLQPDLVLVHDKQKETTIVDVVVPFEHGGE